MAIPSPALVTQSAVRRLPRWALVLFSLLYVLPGFIGRESWKVSDASGFGVMLAMARGDSNWLSPTVFGLLPDTPALLPYWLGAASIQLFGIFDAEFAARIPFGLLLGLTMAAVWYSVYQLAHLNMAQPVVFAFGGQAKRSDYARAMADAGLLMLLACLGLARMGHETTADVAALGLTTLMLWCASAWIAPKHSNRWRSIVVWPLGVVGLSLCGHSLLAMLIAVSLGVYLVWPGKSKSRHRSGSNSEADLGYTTGNDDGYGYGYGYSHSDGMSAADSGVRDTAHARNAATFRMVARLSAVGTALAAVLLYGIPQLVMPSYNHQWLGEPNLGWYRWFKLLVWFVWPAGPLALWALWRWRAHWRSPHIWLPLWFSVAALGVALLSSRPDRSVLLALPGLAVLASFALPTLKRRASALIDWFALLFFTGAGLIIWIIWLAMHTGFPAQPAANVAKLVPGFEAQFSTIPTLLALLVTGMWLRLIWWRTRSVVPALWKSLVLSAGGTTWCWLLLMTLWLPLLDHGLSYGNLSRTIASLVDKTQCVRTVGLSQDQLTSLAYHGKLSIQPNESGNDCGYLLISSDAVARIGALVDLPQWALRQQVWQLNDRSEIIYIYQRIGR
jgi:4-amino-4-deoxy-L-arabinose transferase-like glycosyltransferase